MLMTFVSILVGCVAAQWLLRRVHSARRRPGNLAVKDERMPSAVLAGATQRSRYGNLSDEWFEISQDSACKAAYANLKKFEKPLPSERREASLRSPA